MLVRTLAPFAVPATIVTAANETVLPAPITIFEVDGILVGPAIVSVPDPFKLITELAANSVSVPTVLPAAFAVIVAAIVNRSPSTSEPCFKSKLAALTVAPAFVVNVAAALLTVISLVTFTGADNDSELDVTLMAPAVIDAALLVVSMECTLVSVSVPVMLIAAPKVAVQLFTDMLKAFIVPLALELKTLPAVEVPLRDTAPLAVSGAFKFSVQEVGTATEPQDAAAFKVRTDGTTGEPVSDASVIEPSTLTGAPIVAVAPAFTCKLGAFITEVVVFIKVVPPLKTSPEPFISTGAPKVKLPPEVVKDPVVSTADVLTKPPAATFMAVTVTALLIVRVTVFNRPRVRFLNVTGILIIGS
jgi:hypothetical protein